MNTTIQNKLSTLKIRNKLTLLLGVFFIPLSILGYMLLSSLMEQSHFTSNQVVGLKLAKPTLELIKNRPWGGYARDARSEFNEGLKQVSLAMDAHQSTLTLWANESHDSPISVAELVLSFDQLFIAKVEEEKDRAREKLDSLSLHLVQKISRQSGLILDPDFATYNYIFSSAWLIPKMYRDIREIIHLIDGSDDLTAQNDEVARRATLGVVSSLSPAEIKDTIMLSVNYLSGSTTASTDITRPLNAFVESSHALIQMIESTGDRNWSRDEVLKRAKASEAALSNLAESLSREIESQLLGREKSLEQKFWLNIGLELFTVVILLYLSTAIARNITSPIYALLEALNRAASRGDLSVKVDASGTDELAVMNGSFNKMVEAIRAVVLDVKGSSRSVGGSAEEIAATSRQQQATVNEVAATVVQIEATSKEISATSQQLAKTVNDVHMVAESTAEAATASQNGLVRMEETMSKIVGECATIANRLGALSERATKIGSIVTTISKVADQSNLLSLNAAIEAEKAGDSGRGFTVVASEIRRMADQTAVSSYDIEQTVKEMQSAVSASVMGMERFSDEVRRGVHEVKQVIGELTGIIGQVRELTPRFESVHEGMGCQALGAQQISEAIAQLSIAAQQSAQAVTQSVLCVERLRGASLDLTKGVEKFSEGDGHAAVS